MGFCNSNDFLLFGDVAMVKEDCTTCKYVQPQDFAYAFCFKRQKLIDEIPKDCKEWRPRDEGGKQGDIHKANVRKRLR